jgi:hypothetical protein
VYTARQRHLLKVNEARFERAAGYPAHAPSVTSHQEPSTFHDTREKIA